MSKTIILKEETMDEETFMSQIIEESESHRTGEIIGRNGNLLAEDKDFETSLMW